MTSVDKIGFVVIGRNEGERLVRCLASLPTGTGPIIYVDSGSTDDSIAAASNAGANVVELDTSRAFSAARARNTGYAKLKQLCKDVAYVQFLDGDCQLVPGWVEAAAQALDKEVTLGIVTGRLRETSRDSSIYNAMCDFEWAQPIGDIATCGGNMMVRCRAFDAVEGFDPAIIAAEDDDFCLRLGGAGFRIAQLPVEMGRHDAAMFRFSQWWRRSVRAGHAFAQIKPIHPGHFSANRRRAWMFGALLPLFALIVLPFAPVLLLPVVALYALSYQRTLSGLLRSGLPLHEAWQHAAFMLLAKFAHFQGMLTYYLRHRRKHDIRIIEYK